MGGPTHSTSFTRVAAAFCHQLHSRVPPAEGEREVWVREISLMPTVSIKAEAEPFPEKQGFTSAKMNKMQLPQHITSRTMSP